MLEPGTLIEFKQQGQPRLAVVDRPEGKKNWVVIDERGQAHILHPREFTYQVSGESAYRPDDISLFLEEAESHIDPDSLELAWELLCEAGESADPASLSLLLFSEERPPLCYAAHRLLSEDTIYFKQKGVRYEPRPAAQVEERLHQIQKEQQRHQEWNSFLQKVRQGLEQSPVEWDKADRPRLEALERLACFGDEATQRTLAMEVLKAIGHSKGVDNP